MRICGEKITAFGAQMLGAEADQVDFDGKTVTDGEKSVTLQEIAVKATLGNSQALQVVRNYSSDFSASLYGRNGRG